MAFDTVIKGGRVIDPANNVDGVMDIGVRAGKTEAVAPNLPTEGARVVDASGKYVTPGFIDPHVHLYGGIGLVDPDTVGVHQGVTTIVDFGGGGTATFGHMKELLLPKAKTTIYSVVCLTAGGVGAYGFGTDDQMQIGKLELRELFRTVDENRDFVKGLKSMVSVALGGEFLMLAKSVAHSARIPLVLHLGEFDDYVQWYPGSEYKAITPTVLDTLDRGDLITHCYTPEPGRMFDEAGTLLPKIKAMVDRGVYLDLGHSSHGFDVDVARQGIAHGIPPHTLGTDLHVSSVGPVMRSLADVMSKMLALGLDLRYVVKMVTANPAAFLQITDHAGALTRGFPADVTVFEIQKGEYDWMDSHRNHFPGTDRVLPLGCLKNGTWYPAKMDLVDTRANRSVAVWKAAGVPPATARLSGEQRVFLGSVAKLLEQRDSWDQIDLHYAVEAEREKLGLPLQEGVNALHIAVYGKLAGQQVAWYLGKAKPDFIVPRLKAVAAGEKPVKVDAELEA